MTARGWSDLGQDLGGQQVEVVEVGQVEDLEVEALGADRRIPADRLDALRGRAGDPVVRSSSTSRPMASARRRTSASSRPQHTVQRRGVDQRPGVAADRVAGLAGPVELRPTTSAEENPTLNSAAYVAASLGCGACRARRR